MTFHEAVSQARRERNISLEQLAKAIGVSRSAAHRRDQGDAPFRYDEFEGLAKLFDVSLHRLRAVADLYREDPVAAAQQQVLSPGRVARDVLETGFATSTSLGQPSSGLVLDDDPGEGLYVVQFGVDIRGDAMSPRLNDGDFAVFLRIDPEHFENTAHDGDIVYIRFKDDAPRSVHACVGRYFGERFTDGSMIVTRENPDYDTVYGSLSEVAVMGVLTALKRAGEGGAPKASGPK